MRRWSYLSLRRRILLCAAVVLMLLAFLWALLGYPALTDEGYLRRAERAHLLPAGDIWQKSKPVPEIMKVNSWRQMGENTLSCFGFQPAICGPPAERAFTCTKNKVT